MTYPFFEFYDFSFDVYLTKQNLICHMLFTSLLFPYPHVNGAYLLRNS